MHRFAVIADPHYHEIFPGYRFEGVPFRGRQGAAIRTRDDSAASTRIFNESWLAFRAALEACVAEGVRTVLIAGDLTDDGQIASMGPALALLARYEAEHGLRFFLTPGNHDVYGMSGRDHAKAFYDAAGGATWVTSDPDAVPGPGRSVVDPAMFCRSYDALAPLWAPYGIQRRPEDFYWECPFGTEDAFSARMFEMASPDGSVTHRQLDLSYLVEPEPGLWVVSVDANVFAPRNGRPDNRRPDAFDDSTDAGWNALVRLKPFILDWLADVSKRARALDKTLVCFSHYPVLDPYDDTAADETALFGATQAVRRTPSPETARAVARTGIGTHFSGHLHISDSNSVADGGAALTNIAIPSPVAFPPAFAVVAANGREMEVDHILLDFPDFDAFFPLYGDDAWTGARSYGEFLYGHVRELVVHRYLKREWPQDFAAALQRLSVADLLALAERPDPIAPAAYAPAGEGEGPSGVDLVTDWYAARKASVLVTRFVPASRMALYQRLIAAYAGRSWPDPLCLQARVQRFLAMMARYLDDARQDREAAE
ncbi:metallophosphoesterase [Pelagibacterium lacus]|uniref:Metallophosphoesterase n=1 Tax=Pelagibacterium lacus TaxID=2282655 RepID=A0A369W2S0_9HYPH|nr:metallophosphoesterase [Pelagibacterium lacus]RDE08339.1 metallophosphoesterase [Pelagibacterium lacus]